MIISTMIISSINSYYIAWPCAKIAFALNKKPESQILSAYPACAAFFDGTNAQQEAVVHASFSGEYVTEIGAALDMSFGMAVWVATVLHVVGVEIYVSKAYGHFRSRCANDDSASPYTQRSRAFEKRELPTATRSWNEKPGLSWFDQPG